jgi:hypothetical protein
MLSSGLALLHRVILGGPIIVLVLALSKRSATPGKAEKAKIRTLYNSKRISLKHKDKGIQSY